MRDRGRSKRCRICGKQIPVQAQKCFHCDSFQDWRRFGEYLPAQLTILAAIVTAAVAISPFAISFLHRPDSSVQMGVPAITNDAGFDIPLMNSGDRDARLEFGEVILKTSNSTKRWDVEIDSPPDGMPISRLYPGSFELWGVLRNSFADIRQFVQSNRSDLKDCSMVIHILNFRSGNQQLPPRQFSCDLFARVLETAPPPGKR
jgi:hypothetical protein